MYELSFRIDKEVNREEGLPYLAVSVTPLLDGEPLGDDVFDAARLLAAGTRPHALDIFTCSCGVAGCVGIHDKAELQVSSDQVSWQFPEEPFRERIQPSRAPKDSSAPLHYVFARPQYEQAMSQLRRDLVELEARGGLPVALAPCAYPVAGTRLADHLDHYAARYWEYQSDLEWDKTHFGALYTQAVELCFPGGIAYRASVVTLAYQLAYAHAASSGDTQDNAEDSYLIREVLPVFHSGTAAILLEVASIPWPEMMLLLGVHAAPEGVFPEVPDSPDGGEWAVVEDC